MSTTIVEQDLRISPAEVKKHIQDRQPITILDARSDNAYYDADNRIRGDIRIEPRHLGIDPAWPKEQLTVAYCT
jgi:hypothetical protein